MATRNFRAGAHEKAAIQVRRGAPAASRNRDPVAPETPKHPSHVSNASLCERAPWPVAQRSSYCGRGCWITLLYVADYQSVPKYRGHLYIDI